ncbi:RNA polymerase sigma-70 factor (ECF subfamily) [Williamsia limnetica]|uniref:RNA polymerase sigma-70 factor (ECF subfamily) n=1 Tax=Williamsia limnetica TaxID=882452 RepID=A0A318RKJ8_WILLI|nr:sigma-70 family RNA polymerase sigma factor [Williamsia limnetica]PYE11702.1 RNA polymerase sigma-70 factor (ECF subfamily) [Williamsia limnetica]
MSGNEFLVDEFEAHRGHLRAVAYRMLGSLAEAEDAVQETWLKVAAADSDEVANIGGWFTTVTSRVCLNMLRSRRTRREEPLEIVHVPDPIVAPLDPADDPEGQAVLADSVSVALLVVLETLGPSERLAFVLHDLFAMPFEEVAPIVGKTPAAARKMVSRARARVRGATPRSPGLAEQRRVVDAFTAAARGGDLQTLMAVLDPDVVIRTDIAADRAPLEVVGAAEAARGAVTFQRFTERTQMVLVNGGIGVIAFKGDAVSSIAAFSVEGGRILALNIVADPERLARIDFSGIT